MQVSVTLTGGLDEITRALNILLLDSEDNQPEVPTPMLDRASEVSTGDKPKRHRRTKAEVEAERAAAAKKSEPEDDDEQESDETEEEDDGLGEIEEVEEPKKATKLTLEGDIIPAFRAFAGKHTREKAGKVLAKFGVKSVKDIPAAKYADVLKVLRA